MMTRVFIRKPWMASMVLSIVFLAFISIVRLTKDKIEKDDSLLILAGTYAIFFILAFLDIGYIKAIRAACWKRIKRKYIAISFQLIIIFLFPYLTSKFIYFSVNNEFIFIFLTGFPYIFFLLPLYILFVDRRVKDYNDEYAIFGQYLENLSQKISPRKSLPENLSQTTWRDHKNFLIKTIVKMVFIPYMLGGLSICINTLLNTHINDIEAISTFIFNTVISIDMIVGAFGYLFSSSLLNNQVKDTDKNIIGWIFCLMCYPPLVWIMSHINQQSDIKIWTDFMQPDMPIYWLFFILINGLWIIYLSSSFSFGMSFSNLSWRYLIDFGVFRYTKHPAYIAKNLYWWLHTLPFLGVAWLSPEWWRNMLGLSFVSLIYYGRAKSEERHLSQFPEYRAYMKRIEKDGIFRWLNKRYWQQKNVN